MTDKRLVMYSRSAFLCPYVQIAERVLHKYNVPYSEVDIDTDTAARSRVLEWTGFLSVPTLVVAEGEDVMPYEPPAPLIEASPRGIDRGVMITEPSGKQLETWLRKHGFLDA